eukprot:scaffold80439_cov47-Prasinocladus_malaysianus.AAC.2
MLCISNLIGASVCNDPTGPSATDSMVSRCYGTDAKVLRAARGVHCPADAFCTQHKYDFETQLDSFRCISNLGVVGLPGRDRKVVLWDVSKGEYIAEHELEAPATAAAWAPKANRAELTTEAGIHLAWEGPVPADMSPPHVSLDELDKIADKELGRSQDADKDDGEGAEGNDGMMEFIEEDGDDLEDGKDEEGGPKDPAVTPAKLKGAIRSEVRLAMDKYQRSTEATCQACNLLQARVEPVQAGRFPGSGEKGQREFLTYTLEGFVTTCQDEIGNAIEVNASRFKGACCMHQLPAESCSDFNLWIFQLTVQIDA